MCHIVKRKKQAHNTAIAMAPELYVGEKQLAEEVDEMAYERELAAAKRAAVLAGIEIIKIYDAAGEDSVNMQVSYKEDRSPLTVADRASHEVIARLLGETFPEYGLLSEEGVDDPARLKMQKVFVVDPLDGTKEFIKRNGQFTVNIALAQGGESVMGVIYVPVTGELYWASRGDGAWMAEVCLEELCERSASDRTAVNDSQERVLTLTEEIPLINVRRIHVTDEENCLRAVLSSSHGCPQMEDLLERYKTRITECVRIGSSLKGCLVAKGEAEIYFRHNPTMEWDTAAMQCIVEEAGGIVRQMDDTPLRYNRENCLNEKGFYMINRAENRLR